MGERLALLPLVPKIVGVRVCVPMWHAPDAQRDTLSQR